MLIRSFLFFLSLILWLFNPSISFAVNGYDKWNNTKITIVAGNSIAPGEEIGIYVWDIRRFMAVQIDNIVKKGNDLELEVTNRKSGNQFFFEISADDHGIDSLPHFDPGLPYPEILSPQVHMNNDLLEARGNMIDRGNNIELGNQLEYDTKMNTKNLIEDDTRVENEHLIYQGFQPVE